MIGTNRGAGIASERVVGVDVDRPADGTRCRHVVQSIERVVQRPPGVGEE
jgi:hypothetical protein